MKDVKVWDDFFKKRRESTDVEELYAYHIGNIVLMSMSLALSALAGYRDKYTEGQRGHIPEKFESGASKRHLITALVGARKELKKKGFDLSEAFREVFPPPSPVADPPAAVPLGEWPQLSDRGDGVSGSPVDHELISFPAEILGQLTTGGDVEFDFSESGHGAAGGSVGGSGGDGSNRRGSVGSDWSARSADGLFASQDSNAPSSMDCG